MEAEHRITDEMFTKRMERWPIDTPMTKEAYWYRELFEIHYPQMACMKSIVRWVPRTDWGCPMDPSGRAQKSHKETYVQCITTNGNNNNHHYNDDDVIVTDTNIDCSKTTTITNGLNNNIPIMVGAANVSNGSMVH